MTAVDSNKADKTSFWKKNPKPLPGSIKPVYGSSRPSEALPPPPSPHHERQDSLASTPKKSDKIRINDSFKDFEEMTSDAWDDADDELIEMANFHFRMSLKDVHSTALEVIKNHSQQQQQQQCRSQTVADGLCVFKSHSQQRHSETVVPMPLSPQCSDSGFHEEPSQINGLKYQNGSAILDNEHHQTNNSFSSSSSSSASNTPLHLSSLLRVGGPGLGVRLDWDSAAKQSPFSQLSTTDREQLKLEKFKSLMKSPCVNLDELRTLSWSGIPVTYRAMTWKLLSGYLPLFDERRASMLERKRQEYHNFVDQYYNTRHQDIHQETYRQIHIDIPRMSPLIPLFQQDLVQEIFERILYIWAIRHPASGYVQGINDLVTPIFVVFLTEYIEPEADVANYPVCNILDSNLLKLEADSFWCFSRLLDGIQDNYTFAQPGIQRRVGHLRELISRIDNSLHRHLEQNHVEYLQFSFRWMNNLLMREMPLHCVIRLWDTYLCESDGFASFHLYVCAALLTKFSEELQREHDFQGVMLLLQNLPTRDWTNEDVGLLLADAYRLKFMFADAPKHLKDARS